MEEEELEEIPARGVEEREHPSTDEGGVLALSQGYRKSQTKSDRYSQMGAVDCRSRWVRGSIDFDTSGPDSYLPRCGMEDLRFDHSVHAGMDTQSKSNRVGLRRGVEREK